MKDSKIKIFSRREGKEFSLTIITSPCWKYRLHVIVEADGSVINSLSTPSNVLELPALQRKKGLRKKALKFLRETYPNAELSL